MYERSSSLVLRWLKVPPEPHPPFGDPASLRVFRAGKNFFSLKLAGWAIGQVAALAGIIFWIVVFIQVEDGARLEKVRRAGTPGATPATLAEKIRSAAESAATIEPGTPGVTSGAAAKPARNRAHIGGWPAFKQGLIEIALVLPAWSFPLIWVLKIAGLVVYFVQIPFTYAIMRLDYEMRWYVVTDRSLRIRTGVWSVQELTMSFANLQQVVVEQGPVQRLLGLADVRVQSAGGGGGGEHPRQQAQGESLHTGNFHCVENAHEIRDLVLARLKHFREAGLGDPEEAHRATATAAQAGTSGPGAMPDELIAAARELAAEARALRVALG